MEMDQERSEKAQNIRKVLTQAFLRGRGKIKLQNHESVLIEEKYRHRHAFYRNVLYLSKFQSGGGGEVLPYKGLMGTCGQPGYVFRDFCLKQGIEFIIFCLNQGIGLAIFVLNRISFLGLNSKLFTSSCQLMTSVDFGIDTLNRVSKIAILSSTG